MSPWADVTPLSAALPARAGGAVALTGQYLQFERHSSISPSLVLAVLGSLAGAMAALYLLHLLITTLWRRRRTRVPAARGAPQRPSDLRLHAARLGFRIAEIKTLRQIAGKLAPDEPDSLLRTDAGRERLTADINSRVQRRQREIEHLQGILGKLDLMRDRGLRERAAVRVDADLPIWIVERPGEGASSDDEEIYLDAEQVPGRLLDISEGGAAITADLHVEVHDVLELWSADSSVWIPPVAAGVLGIERAAGQEHDVYHLHFIDPPQQELRAVVQALQRQQAARR